MLVNRSRKHRGDTLVEVLMAILVLSTVLAGAYVTTSRSALGIRNSQENGEALKLLQGQLEQIRQNASALAAPVFSQPQGTPFCLVDAVVTTGATCTRNRSDQAAAANETPAYDISVVRGDCGISPTPPCHKFTVKATWDTVTGNGPANEQLTIRLYQ